MCADPGAIASVSVSVYWNAAIVGSLWIFLAFETSPRAESACADGHVLGLLAEVSVIRYARELEHVQHGVFGES